MIDNRAVGKTIATLRQNRNMTQQQLAATLNVSHQAVSKWENGAALPDVQTLMDLTRLFGITMEQLLNGEVPEERLENRSPLEEPIQNIGTFFNSIVNGIFTSPRKAEENEEAGDEDDGADEAITQEGSEEEDAPGDEDPFDLEKLLQMAPFMSRQAVDALLMEHRKELTAADIARFAPFITRECLEKLIQNPETEITWETLQRIAPFLKREMVDKLAKLAAKGSRAAQESAKSTECDAGDDLGKALEDVGNFIGSGMEKMARRAVKLGEDVANEMTNAINSFVEGTRSRDERAQALRHAACERALQDERWDWLEAHIDDITDEALLRAIAQKANSRGMHDWVLEHMNGYADTRTIDAAIEAGNWGWLGDHVWQFEDDWQEKIALAAAKAENWQWLSTYAEQISLENCADRIAIAAYEADAHVLVLQLAEHCMNAAQKEALANAIVAKGDYDFLAELAPQLAADYFGRLCLARAQEKEWGIVARFVEKADPASVARMMELAIAEGNFDAVDLLNPYL